MESKKGFRRSLEMSPPEAASLTSTVFRPQSPFRSAPASPYSPTGSGPSTEQFNPNVKSEPISCVSKQTFQQDCARHRFIVWAAVKRNSCARMRPEEKLRCPLLQCNRQFPDHEGMLQHLAACDHLASGQYWCYDHTRIERFDDVKCKHCLGHPSKRRKVLSMAKSFFHSLGHRSKRSHGLSLSSKDPSPATPTSYYSLSSTPQSELAELPAIHLVEADSKEIMSLPSKMSMDIVDVDPQALLAPTIPERDCTRRPVPPLPRWDQTQAIRGLDTRWNDRPDIAMSNASDTPLLQLHTTSLPRTGQFACPSPQVLPTTQSKNLSPTSSLRSNNTANSKTTTSTSLISPVSHWSGGWLMESGFNTGSTSPVDDILGANPFKTCATGSGAEPCDVNYLDPFCSEHPANIRDSTGTVIEVSDPLLLASCDTFSVDLPYANASMIDEDLDPILNGASVPGHGVCCSEAESLVSTVHLALRAHIQDSVLKLQEVPGNQLAGQLRSMSTRSVALAGLRTLRLLLNGGRPSTTLDTLCFIHLTYALSIITFEQQAQALASDLFTQSLSYATKVPLPDITVYEELVSLIWRPQALELGSMGDVSRSLVARGKMPESAFDFGRSPELGTDSLLEVAANVLDKLEICLLLRQSPSSPEGLASELYRRHHTDINLGQDIMQPTFPAAAQMAIQILHDEFTDVVGLSDKLNNVFHNLQSGKITSVRRLELELMEAGMVCMGALLYHFSYVPAARRQCDQMYEYHSSGTSPRLAYHNDAISLFESLLPSDDPSDGTAMIPTKAPIPVDLSDQRTHPHLQSHHQLDLPVDPLVFMLDASLDWSRLFCADSKNTLIPTVVNAPPDSFDYGHISFDTSVESYTGKPSPSSSFDPQPISATSAPERRQQQRQQQLQLRLQHEQNHTDHHQAQQRSDAQQPPPPSPSSSQQQQPPQALGETYTRCPFCGYVPKGDPQWFRGSMAKHMKTMHSPDPPKIYKCPFPGCTSQFKNRADNLRQHQLVQGHFVDGEGGGAGDGGARERPVKRKKVGEEGR